ncbi:aminopeptidase N-like [Adelges cooleyi]|uniref:aminopeptidase N-like n=1 Tax=Adelges cooleyi TaxID=133065 RepID=UPI00217F5C51|nr:aminopeptidase N-like [Adelges cooleyi]
MLEIILLALSCCGILADNDETVFRLPGDTIPLSYNLKFVDLLNDDFSYNGVTKILIQVKSTTTVLTLNAFELDIKNVKVVDTELSREINVTNFELIKKNEQLKVNLKEPWLIAGRQYNVEITYNGTLRTDMTGLYRSSYKDEESNATRWLAISQFEPTYARRAFPCYDEPGFKTPFQITIVKTKKTQISLSNYPVYKEYQDVQTGKFVSDYPVTEPMPTYLVAISVSEFVEKSSNDNKFHVYTHKEYINQTDYIREKAPKLLNLMEVFTGISYPIDKMDLLAVPDFAAGAMENWGLNTYQEKYLLISEKSTEKSKELVTTVVQHELTHQWFGNLVTCAWWDYLWLNEAFATFFEYFAVQVAEPEWRMEELFVIEQHQAALSYDQRPRHAITSSVQSPDEIEGIFDGISYDKGASVLRMLKYTLGSKLFRDSLILYLKTHKYASAEPNNLWDAIDSVLFDTEYKLADNVQVRDFMRSWTENPGYPVLSVTAKTKNTLSVTQKRFLVDKKDESVQPKWYIGLTYTTQQKNEFHDVQPVAWLKPSDDEKTIKFNSDEGWVIFNVQSTGFYRVNYDLNNWGLLIDQLRSDPKAIHVLNRAQLIDDAFNLARGGELPFTVPFELISYLDNENDFIPWYSAYNGISYAFDRMRRCDFVGPKMQNFTRNLAAKVYSKVNKLYEDKHDRRHLTVTSFDAFSSWACKFEVPECIESATAYFKTWQSGIDIPADIKEAALCTGVRNGGEREWNDVFNLYLNTFSTSERQAAQLALACSKNTTILNNYLEILLQGENCTIRPNHYRLMIKSLASTPVGIDVMTKFLKDRWQDSLKLMWNGEETIKSMYSTLASKVSIKSEIDQLNAVKNQTGLPLSLSSSFNASHYEVELNLRYFKKAHDQLHNWFGDSSITTPAPTLSSATSISSISNIILCLIIIMTCFLFK